MVSVQWGPATITIVLEVGEVVRLTRYEEGSVLIDEVTEFRVPLAPALRLPVYAYHGSVNDIATEAPPKDYRMDSRQHAKQFAKPKSGSASNLLSALIKRKDA
jgi:hypothetical protein